MNVTSSVGSLLPWTLRTLETEADRVWDTICEVLLLSYFESERTNIYPPGVVAIDITEASLSMLKSHLVFTHFSSSLIETNRGPSRKSVMNLFLETWAKSVGAFLHSSQYTLVGWGDGIASRWGWSNTRRAPLELVLWNFVTFFVEHWHLGSIESSLSRKIRFLIFFKRAENGLFKASWINHDW